MSRVTSGMCTTAIPEVTSHENTLARLPATRSSTLLQGRLRHLGSPRHPASRAQLKALPSRDQRRPHPSQDRLKPLASRDWLRPRPPPGRTARCLSSLTSRCNRCGSGGLATTTEPQKGRLADRIGEPPHSPRV